MRVRSATPALGNRQDRRSRAGPRRTIAPARPRWPGSEKPGGPPMADVAYLLALLGGFAVLVATLRGLAKL